MTDDDTSPEQRQDHYRRYPPSTPVVREDPTAEELGALARLERIERNQEALQSDVASLKASRETSRKMLWLVIPALVGGMATVLLYAADKITASSERVGETTAEIRNLKEQNLLLRDDVKELRAALRRQTGIDIPPRPSSDIDDPDVVLDKFSSLWPAQSGVAPASTGGGANGVIGADLQKPALQNPHVPPNCLHSELLEHLFRHPPSGPGLGAGVTDCGGELLQAAITVAMTSRAMRGIPHL